MGKKVKLTDACEFQGGSQPPKNQWINRSEEGYVRMLQIRDFTQKNVQTEYVKLTNTTKLCGSSDVLIARYGASVGKILTGLKGAYNVAIMKTIPDEKVLLKKYLYYYLNSTEFQQIIKNVGSRAAQAGFNKEDLADIEIYLPKIEAQKKIVKVLEKAEKALEKRKEAIKLLDELIKSKFIEMFGDPVKNQKKLPKVELARVGEWKTGGTPSRSNNEYYNGNISWLSSGELNNMYCFNSVEMITELAIKESSAKIIEKGSLLLGMYDTAALKSTINMIECSCNQAIAYSKLDEKLVNTIYVYYCIQIGKDFYKSQQRGVRQKNLNLSMIKGLEILMPDLRSQNQFANFVNQVDKLKFEMEKSLEEMENNFNSLMQRAFKGELFK